MPPNAKQTLYNTLVDRLDALIGGEGNLIARAANTAALLFHSLPELNWAGFYFLADKQLVLGPFQGKPACLRIPLGKGVCGTAAGRRETIVVQNVREFPGHIACDCRSNSEIVVPIENHGKLIAVLDLDSPQIGRFDTDDKAGLQRVVEVFTAGIEADSA